MHRRHQALSERLSQALREMKADSAYEAIVSTIP